MEQVKRILMRGVRGFIAGGVASIAAFVAAGINITDTDGLKKLGFALAASFISGGLLALDKLIRESQS